MPKNQVMKKYFHVSSFDISEDCFEKYSRQCVVFFQYHFKCQIQYMLRIFLTSARTIIMKELQ